MSRLPGYARWKEMQKQLEIKESSTSFSVKPCDNPKCNDMTWGGKKFCTSCQHAYELGKND